MKEADFKGTQSRLFGQDFGEKAKAKLKAASALKKSIYPSSSKSKQTSRQVFGQATLAEITEAGRVVGQTTTALEDHHGKIRGQQAADKKRTRTPHVSNLIKFVSPTPKLTQLDAPKGHLEVLISQMDLTINSPNLLGILAQYINNWQKILMGLVNHIRVLPRVDSGTLADKAHGRNNVLIGGAGKDLRRDQRTLIQGCNRGDNNLQGKLCITDLSS